MSDALEFVTREDLPEAIVITVTAQRVVEEVPAFGALRAALAALPDGTPRSVILDLAAVEFLSSACVGCFITAHRRLTAAWRPLPPPRPAHRMWRFFPDRTAALAEVSRWKCDPFVFCGVSANIREIFEVCG